MATTGRRAYAQAVANVTACCHQALCGLLLLQQSDNHRNGPTPYSVKSISPLLIIFCLFRGTYLSLLITYKSEERNEKLKEYIIKRNKN